MTNRARQAHADWLKADNDAREAESALKKAWFAFETGGPVPPDSLVADVSRLRAVANDRLTMAMLALGEARAASYPGRNGPRQQGT